MGHTHIYGLSYFAQSLIIYPQLEFSVFQVTNYIVGALLTLQGPDVGLPELGLLAGALVAPNHFQMALEHFDRFVLLCSRKNR